MLQYLIIKIILSYLKFKCIWCKNKICYQNKNWYQNLLTNSNICNKCKKSWMKDQYTLSIYLFEKSTI